MSVTSRIYSSRKIRDLESWLVVPRSDYLIDRRTKAASVGLSLQSGSRQLLYCSEQWRRGPARHSGLSLMHVKNFPVNITRSLSGYPYYQQPGQPSRVLGVNVLVWKIQPCEIRGRRVALLLAVVLGCTMRRGLKICVTKQKKPHRGYAHTMLSSGGIKS